MRRSGGIGSSVVGTPWITHIQTTWKKQGFLKPKRFQSVIKDDTVLKCYTYDVLNDDSFGGAANLEKRVFLPGCR
ncbi:MAG: hypothetical protein EA361_12040 [Bacteroidetes bacterium]|nr:MAG: hypothetical protein EA361_12040 [Bacteroidota bacterium]